MHIPSHFLNDPVSIATTIGGAAALGVGVAQVRRSADPRSAGLMAVTAAGVFAAQMVNFPIAHGTSGHMIGAAVAAILLGPWAAMLTVAMVLVAQCLLFGDGGITSLGANVLNMAVAGPLVASALYEFTRRHLAGRRGIIAASAVAGIGCVMAAALLCSFELIASGQYAASSVLPAMLGVHLAIGLAEGLTTAAIVGLVLARRPSLITGNTHALARPNSMWAGLGGALALAAVGGPLASSLPDGLESVAEKLGLTDAVAPVSAVLGDYQMPGVSWEPLAVALAGIVGVLAVFALTYGFGKAAMVRVPKHRREHHR